MSDRSEIATSRSRLVAALSDVRRCTRPRVLIADDNDDFCQELSQALDRRGLNADVAHDGRGVTILLARRQYALLLLDGGAGPEIGEAPVLYMTGDLSAVRPGTRSKLDGVDAIADEALRLIAGR